jgi:hypothetical protein
MSSSSAENIGAWVCAPASAATSTAAARCSLLAAAEDSEDQEGLGG